MDDVIVAIQGLTVAGGAFLVSVTDGKNGILSGSLTLFVGSEPRSFALGSGHPAASQSVSATSPALLKISQGWGHAADAGKTLEVCYQPSSCSAKAIIP